MSQSILKKNKKDLTSSISFTNTPVDSISINKKTVKFHSLDNLNRNLEFDDDTEEKPPQKRLEIVHENHELLVDSSKQENVIQTGFKTATGRILSVEKANFQHAVNQFEKETETDHKTRKSIDHIQTTTAETKVLSFHQK